MGKSTISMAMFDSYSDFPIKNGDFPWLYQLLPGRVSLFSDMAAEFLESPANGHNQTREV